MKLLMTADAVGGVWTYALDLARGLQAHGIETTLAVNGPPPAELPADVETVATGLPLDWLAQTPEEVERAGAGLAALASDLGVDLVQVNSPAYAAGARWPVPVVGVQHSCTATWWRAVNGDAPWPDDFRWRFDLARRGLLTCNAVVAPTAAFAAAVQREYTLTSMPTVVWNGREPSSPSWGRGQGERGRPASTTAVPTGGAETAGQPPPSPNPLRQKRGEGSVFTAGRLWDESKGIAVLDEAAAHIDTPVIAAGPLAAPGSPDAARFQNLRTPGVLSSAELQARLAEAAVFVSPALYEPFGLAVLEAAQVGRPLVLSDIATFRELWDGAAVFTPPRDASALADAVNALLADAERRAALGQAAAERSRRYTVERMAAEMTAALRGVLRARAAA